MHVFLPTGADRLVYDYDMLIDLSIFLTCWRRFVYIYICMCSSALIDVMVLLLITLGVLRRTCGTGGCAAQSEHHSRSTAIDFDPSWRDPAAVQDSQHGSGSDETPRL